MYNIERNSEKLYDFLAAYIDKHQYAPSNREMAAAMGGCSTSSISRWLRVLEAKGKLHIQPDRSRAIVLHDYAIRLTSEEYHLIHAAWGDDYKDTIIQAASNARITLTA